MKVLIALDSFKGSLSSEMAGNAAKEGVLRVFPDAEISVLSIADGGEGTVRALCSATETSAQKLCRLWVLSKSAPKTAASQCFLFTTLTKAQSFFSSLPIADARLHSATASSMFSET